MIHIYTGDGKGKTTAALGLALRAVGAGKKVLLIQFLKDGRSSELKAIKRISGFDFKTFGKKGFTDKNNLTQKDFDLARQGFIFFKEALESKKYDLIISDEINVALDFKLIETSKLVSLLKKNSSKTEIVLTGRGAPKKIVSIADLVTEMKKRKHYLEKGIKARRGIEY